MRFRAQAEPKFILLAQGRAEREACIRSSISDAEIGHPLSMVKIETVVVVVQDHYPSRY